MPANLFDIGDVITLRGAFTVSGIATDPTTITLTLVDPSGNSETLTYAGGDLTKSSTGVYTYNVSLDEAGTWRYRFVGTGTAAAADEGRFYVKEQVAA